MTLSLSVQLTYTRTMRCWNFWILRAQLDFNLNCKKLIFYLDWKGPGGMVLYSILAGPFS